LLTGWLIALCLSGEPLMAEETQLIIDDRRSGNHTASGGGNWRLVKDSVMGGVSAGQLTAEEVDGRPCLRLQGEVSTKNSGGFIQAALELETGQLRDASGYDGVVIDVRGNGESYNLHLRPLAAVAGLSCHLHGITGVADALPAVYGVPAPRDPGRPATGPVEAHRPGGHRS
jgi:hypothetical protein